MNTGVHVLFQIRKKKRKSVNCSVMSNSLRSHGLEPTSLLCPWSSPGKKTGVGCHFLLQGDLPDPGIKPVSLMSPALQVHSLPLSHQRSPIRVFVFSGYMPRSEIAGSYSYCICSLKKVQYCFTQCLHQFTFPPIVWEGPLSVIP